jgi:thioesterase domain-containing protein
VNPLALREVLRIALGRQIETAARPLGRTLVPLRREGRNAPLFCVHAAGGGFRHYVPLTRHLDRSRPVYAVHDPWSNASAPESIEEMASRYIEDLRGLQPTGPYHLAGWSFGGMLAFEMALQLAAAGERVPVLVVFDSRIAMLGKFSRLRPLELAVLFGRLLGLGKQDVRLSKDTRSQLAALDDALDHVRGLVLDRQVLPANTGPEMFRQMFETLQRHARLLRKYRPGRYDGTLTAVLATSPRTSGPDDGGWGAYTHVDVHQVAGDHFSILQEPAVGDVARIAEELLIRHSSQTEEE